MERTRRHRLAAVMVLDVDQLRQSQVHQILEEEVAARITCRLPTVLLVDQVL
jgi:hypothetical protein